MESHIAAENLLLALGIENFNASDNEDLIKEVAKQLLATIGDYLEVEEKIKREDETQEEQKLQTQISFSEYVSSALKKVVNTIGVVFDWLEHSTVSKDKKLENKQKRERVLRALIIIVGLGSFTSLIVFCELAIDFLDIPENLYKVKREHVRECLKVIEDQKQPLFKLMNDAAEMLDSIIQEFHHTKALQFDNVVRQANDVIALCKDYGDTAMKTIEELTTNATTLKWCLRGFRLACWALTCSVIYYVTPSLMLDIMALYFPTVKIWKMSSDSTFDLVSKAALCVVSGYVCMSFNTSGANTFQDSITSLKCQHLRLTKGLKHLEKKIQTAQDVFDGARKSKPS